MKTLQEINKFIEEKTHGYGKLLFAGLVGSHAYNTNIETSDEDYGGIYILDEELILGDLAVEKEDGQIYKQFYNQVSDDSNDVTFYEIKRFLELCKTSNPTVLTLLNLPEECIIYKHSVFEYVLENRDKFLTKICRDSFAGYAIKQISKSRGLKKKIMNPIAKEKKTPIDFCYVIDGHKSYPLRKIMERDKMNQLFCGLVNVPNARDIYSLYYDIKADTCFNEKRFNEEERKSKIKEFKSKGEAVGLGYKGIEKENGNDIRLSSIPKEQKPVAIISYNKDGYTKYCKDYKEYWEWVKKRNPARYENNVKHGKNYDSKNMMHCYRLIETAMDILDGKGLVVKRPNREKLLKIRKGEYEYDKLVSEAEEKIALLDELFDKSDLPDKVENKFVHELLVKIRKEFYEK